MRVLLRVVLASLAVLSVDLARADGDSAAAVDRIVRATWIEGLPYAEAAALPPEAVPYMAALLDGPDAASFRANAVLALGMCGHPGAWESLAAWAAAAPIGPIDGPEFRARLAFPIALGHLARSDDRALARLLTETAQPASPASWSYRHVGPARAAALLRAASIEALGIAGRASADARLRQLERAAPAPSPTGVPTSEWDVRGRASRARALGARVRDQGPGRVFGPGAER